MEQYIVTAALPYANGPIHIGHIAGAYLPADIYARYLKLLKKDVVFICGSDEHGAAITLRAKKDKKEPKDIIDFYHELNKKSFKDLNINFDEFDRTSSKEHHENARNFFHKLHSKKVFIEKETEQFFDKENNQFLADRYITGTCPHCNYNNAYGDQCESCGSTLSPTELINPKSTISGNSPILKKTSHWYLPMQKHEEWLKEWIEKGILNGKKHHNHKDWKSQVIGQCKSWLKAGLRERAMTRDLDWGVKVPLENTEGKVLYVWLDAPIGYISATKKWGKKNNRNWEDYWKNNNTKLINFIGKDNIVFHCIIFPIILKEHGEYILPTNVPSNEFLNLEGKKISTSRNHAIWVHEYLNSFPEKVDVLRYVLCSIAPENKDSDFTWKDFQARNNNELVAIFGNFVNRVLVLINKYWDGIVPPINDSNIEEDIIIKQMNLYANKIGQKIEKYKFRDGLFELINLARLGNKYLAENEPWKLFKSDPHKTETILNICVQIVFKLAVLSQPFLPNTSKKLSELLNCELTSWESISKTQHIKEGHKLNKPQHLFEQISDEIINQEIEKLNSQL